MPGPAALRVCLEYIPGAASWCIRPYPALRHSVFDVLDGVADGVLVVADVGAAGEAAHLERVACRMTTSLYVRAVWLPLSLLFCSPLSSFLCHNLWSFHTEAKRVQQNNSGSHKRQQNIPTPSPTGGAPLDPCVRKLNAQRWNAREARAVRVHAQVRTPRRRLPGILRVFCEGLARYYNNTHMRAGSHCKLAMWPRCESRSA